VRNTATLVNHVSSRFAIIACAVPSLPLGLSLFARKASNLPVVHLMVTLGTLPAFHSLDVGSEPAPGALVARNLFRAGLVESNWTHEAVRSVLFVLIESTRASLARRAVLCPRFLTIFACSARCTILRVSHARYGLIKASLAILTTTIVAGNLRDALLATIRTSGAILATRRVPVLVVPADGTNGACVAFIVSSL